MEHQQVDLRELAIDRKEPVRCDVPPRRHLLTRYVIPGVLVTGFFSLLVWAAWEFIVPPHRVSVAPVFATTSELRQSGTPLFQAAGWIEPRPTPVRVAALATGVVAKLLVVEDQVVKMGEPIALLVEEDARLAHRRTVSEVALRAAELDAAKAVLQAAEVRHEQPVHLDASLGEAEASLAKIDTEVRNLPFLIRRAQAEYEATRKDFNRKLEVKELIASVEIDLAKGRLDSALALLEGLRDREEALKQERAAILLRRDALGTQRELLTSEIREKQVAASKVKVAAARVERARVAVAEAKLRLDRMTVRSPIDGRVFRLVAHPGARMGDTMTQMDGHDGRTVVTLYRPEMLQVRVDVRFEDIPRVLPNQPVVIENPALASSLGGTVLFINSEADIQKNTLQVKVAITDPPPVFKPEMLVDVTFMAPQGEVADGRSRLDEVQLFVLPSWIHTDDQGKYVWIADPLRRVAKKKRIQTGAIGTGGLVSVTQGLNSSSRIIVAGTQSLGDGDRIEIHSDAEGASDEVLQKENLGNLSKGFEGAMR